MFSLLTNQLKALKNTLVILGIPFLLYLVDNYLQLVPENYKNPITLFLLGYISYSVKNYLENKNG
jgi:choline-glycine betaine transporter